MKKAATIEIKPIMEKLNSRQSSNVKDAFICDRETFELIYQLEKKRVRRNKSPAFILSLEIIDDELVEGELDKISSRLLTVFRRRLRPGDTVCKWDVCNFVLLINNIEEETIKRLIERINYFFYSLLNINHRKSWIDILKKIEFIWNYKIIEANKLRGNIEDYKIL